MRTAKVKVNTECGVRRPIRVHLTVSEANRLASLLSETIDNTGHQIDTLSFYNQLDAAIELAQAS